MLSTPDMLAPMMVLFHISKELYLSASNTGLSNWSSFLEPHFFYILYAVPSFRFILTLIIDCKRSLQMGYSWVSLSSFKCLRFNADSAFLAIPWNVEVQERNRIPLPPFPHFSSTGCLNIRLQIQLKFLSQMTTPSTMTSSWVISNAMSASSSFLESLLKEDLSSWRSFWANKRWFQREGPTDLNLKLAGISLL